MSLWVDINLGNDITGNGSYLLPYATPAKAISVMTTNEEINLMSNLDTVRNSVVANFKFTNANPYVYVDADVTGSVNVGDLIGKPTASGNGAIETFYLVAAITASRITLDTYYYGTTETVASIYIIVPQDSGTGINLPIFYINRNIAGWSFNGGFTSETEQNGETWLKPTTTYTNSLSDFIDCSGAGLSNGRNINKINGICYKIIDTNSIGTISNDCSIYCYYQIHISASATETIWNRCRISVNSRGTYILYSNRYLFQDCILSGNGSTNAHFGISYNRHRFLNCKLYGIYITNFAYNYEWDFTGTEFYNVSYVFNNPVSFSKFEGFKCYNCSYVSYFTHTSSGSVLKDFEAHNTGIIYSKYSNNILVENFTKTGTGLLLINTYNDIPMNNIFFSKGTITASSSLFSVQATTNNIFIYDITIDKPLFLNIGQGGYYQDQFNTNYIVQNVPGIEKHFPEGYYGGNTSVTKSTECYSTPPGIAIRNYVSMSTLYANNPTIFFRKIIDGLSNLTIVFKYKMEPGWVSYSNPFRFVALCNSKTIKEFTSNVLTSLNIVTEWTDMTLNVESLLLEKGLFELGAICNMNSHRNFYIDEIRVF